MTGSIDSPMANTCVVTSHSVNCVGVSQPTSMKLCEQDLTHAQYFYLGVACVDLTTISGWKKVMRWLREKCASRYV